MPGASGLLFSVSLLDFWGVGKLADFVVENLEKLHGFFPRYLVSGYGEWVAEDVLEELFFRL